MTVGQLLKTEKKDKLIEDYDIEVQIAEKKALNSEAEEEATVYKDTTYPVVISQRRAEKQKKRCCVQLCLFMGMMLGLSLCVLGSVFLYRNIYYVRYSGRCGVGLVDMSGYEMNYTDIAPTPEAFTSNKGRADIEEEIDIDGQIETLKTPGQYNATAATFRHDFDRNMTAIKDLQNEFCYFVPFINAFNNGMIPTPREFSSFLENKQPGDSPQVYEKHEYFERRDPVADAMSQFGEALSEICDGAPGYVVEPRTFSDYDFATTQATYTTMSPFDIDYMFRMYPGGSDIFTYHIYTFELEDY